MIGWPTCEVCGKPLKDYCMTVALEDDEFYVCSPRTDPSNKCWNRAKRKLLEVFAQSDKAKAMLSDLDQADCKDEP